MGPYNRSIPVDAYEAAFRNLLVRVLEREGGEAAQAMDRDVALKQKAKWPVVDLLLTHIVRPGRVQGDALAEHFAEFQPDKPVFLVSVTPELAETQSITTSGSHFLIKPVK